MVTFLELVAFHSYPLRIALSNKKLSQNILRQAHKVIMENLASQIAPAIKMRRYFG